MNVTLFHNSSPNNQVSKTLTLLRTLGATHLQPMSLEAPELILSSSNVDMGSCNYMYIDVFDRYYFVDSYVILSAGRIQIRGKIDVLHTYRNALLASAVHAIRWENAGINNVPDSLLPLAPERQLRVLRFPEELQNSNFNANTRCFILTVAGGGLGQSPSVAPTQLEDKEEDKHGS